MKTKIHLILSVIFLLMITTSCGGDTQEQYYQQALKARTQYLGLQQGTSLCHITADYGQRVYDFSLVLTLSRDQDQQLVSTLTLTAPEEIAGISVTAQGGSSQLRWEGMILETGDLNQEGLSPVSAIPLFLETLCSGYLESVTMTEKLTQENPLLTLFCRDPDKIQGTGQEITLWLDSQTYALVGGEIFQDGVRVLSCEFQNFLMS